MNELGDYVPLLRDIPIGLKRVARVVLALIAPHRLNRLEIDDLLARHLVRRRHGPRAKAEIGRQLVLVVAAARIDKLLVVGAHAVLFHRKSHTDPLRMWAKKLIEKKPFKLVAVALANKMARIAFAIMRGETTYREIPA